MASYDYYGDNKSNQGPPNPGQAYNNAPYQQPPSNAGFYQNSPYEQHNQPQGYPPQGYQPQYQQQQYDEPRYQHQPPPYQQHQHQQPGQPGQYSYAPQEAADPSGDRGFMGALAGGATGAYAGHKMHHGVLGTIGGAITGSLAEDAIKKHKKKKEEEEEEEQRQRQRQRQEEEERERQRLAQQQQQQQHQAAAHHSGRGNVPRGNFAASSVDIELHDRSELRASCRGLSGQFNRSHFSLNSVLSNHWGHFKWARGGNFAASARNIRLTEGGKVLEAELDNGHGGWNWDRVRLDDRIENKNGHLVFLD